ncbi:ATPase family AAA domain-containing protein 5-like [Palaemon carinicauda]|uniref:ATPase family AAA domain-containing protein 5-like n=1 Tax=Palaemon carinicauda TaxID=392227 RepID=UPI0035B62303
MPHEEVQEMSSQQKVEKGSILSYFTKKNVTTMKSKIKATDSSLSTCDDPNTDKVEEKIIEEKNEENADVSVEIIRKQTESDIQSTENITKTGKTSHFGKECAVTEDLSSNKVEDFEVISNKNLNLVSMRLDANVEKSHSYNNVVKHKNIFAFMMANRDKQNEVLNKITEEEESMIMEETENNREKHDKSTLLGDSLVPQKNDEVDEIAVDLQLTKDRRKTQIPKEENSPLKRKKSPRKRSKLDKSKEVLSAKVSKLNSNDIVSVSDDDFVGVKYSKNKNINKVGFVSGKQVKGKHKTAEKNSNISEKSNGGDKVNDDLVTPEKNNEKGECFDVDSIRKIDVMGGMKNDKAKHTTKHLEATSDISIDRVNNELVVPQISQDKSVSSVEKVQTAPVIGNAFTLLMTNRHKMNRNIVERKDDLSDEDTCSVDIKHHRSQKVKAGKSGDLEPKKRGRKRKNSLSCELDSSLDDFEDIPKKKKRSKVRNGRESKKQGAANNEILSESNNMIDASCDDIEVNVCSKELVEDKTNFISVADVQDINECEELVNIGDHDDNKSMSCILKETENCSDIKGESSNHSVVDAGGEKYCNSSDELALHRNSKEMSRNSLKNIKADVTDIDMQNKVKKETKYSNANLSEISDGEEKLGNDIITSSFGTIQENSSDEGSLTLKLRRVRKLRRTSKSKSAVIIEAKTAREDGVGDICKEVQGGDNQPATEQVSSVILTSPPKKRRKKVNCVESDDELENIIDCSDKSPLHTKSKVDDFDAECNMAEISNGASVPITKKGNIATFFKKMSKEERAVERSKTFLTIKADVHAPCEGYSPSKKSRTNTQLNRERTQVRRSSRRLKKDDDDLDKIELLEQIQLNSPKKSGNENVKKDVKIKGVSKIDITAEISAVDGKPCPAHVDGDVLENSEGRIPIDNLLTENIDDDIFVNKPMKVCKKSEKSSQAIPNYTGSEEKVEPNDICLDESVCKISVKGITKMAGEKMKKRPLGRKKQPKLIVNKIKEAKSERKMISNNPLQKKKRKREKQVRRGIAKHKIGKKITAKSESHKLHALDNGPADVAEKEEILNLDNSVTVLGSDGSLSSPDEIFIKKTRKTKFCSPPRVIEATEEVNDDKENVEQARHHGAKKSRSVESAVMLSEGSSFQSFDEWNSHLEKLKTDGHNAIRIRDSRSIDAIAKLSGKVIKPSLKYGYVVYECSFSSTKKLKKSLKISQQKSKVECPWKLKVISSADGKSLVIKEICLDHNHLVEKEKEGSPTVTRNCSSEERELVNLDTPGLSSSADQQRQIKAPTGSKNKRQREVRKVVTCRKLLSSQENVKNQIQNQLKTLKTNGKRKRSPKNKKKRICAEILALQDNEVKKMAETNIKVYVAVDEKNVNVISEESSCSKETKAISKKLKISPLVLKPPPKELKLTKMKERKKHMKKNKEVKEQKKKLEKNTEVCEESKVVASRPSRKAAMKVRKMFQEMCSSEDSDVSEIETVPRSSIKDTNSKAFKAKDRKSEKKEVEDLPKKGEKLAPIFCKRPRSPEIEVLKTQLSPSKLKARQDFLQSGVPEQIKKQQLLEKNLEEQLTSSAPFPKFSHIQQRSDNEPLWNLISPKALPLKEDADIDLPKCTSTSVYQMNMFSKAKPIESQSPLTEGCTFDVNSLAVILNALKRNNPRFPVFSIFKSYFDLKKEAVESYKRELAKEDKISVIDLEKEEIKLDKRKGLAKRGRKKKGYSKLNRSQEMQEMKETGPPLPIWHERIPYVWTQVYAPKKGSHVIGNKGHVKKLKRWLQEWKSKSEAFAVKEKNKKARLSKKDDDFLQSEESSDEENFVSTYLLCGPPGVGKTAVVYALATELGYNVLEVNASSKRPGKHVMSQLAEATQSHSVSNSSNQPTNAIASLFATKSTTKSKLMKNKVAAAKEAVSKESNRDLEKKKGLSVVLFEDIDIVFEESDEGFLSTVNNFMITTKRPIILTVSHPSYSALSKIKSHYERLDFEPPAEDLIAQHLQLICLVNGQHICLDDIENLVSVNKCDIRQSLLDVQVWSNSGSSLEKCTCLSYFGTGNAEVVKEAVTLSDIFSENIKTNLKTVKTYKKELWGKVHFRYNAGLIEHNYETDASLNSRILSKEAQPVTWNQAASSLPFLLPYSIKEKKKINKYPLQADDPSLKTTYLWQKYNWLSIDEDEDEPVASPVLKNERDIEPEKLIQVPQYVIDSSKKCVASLSRYFDTVAELDILHSKYILAQPSRDTKCTEWWKRHPMPGLSDLESHYMHWEPYTLTPCFVEEIGQRAFNQCYHETKQQLELMPTKDWDQVSLPIQEKEKPALLELQPNANERALKEQEKIDETVLSHIPLVHQLNHKGFMDYLSFARSVIRHDELNAMVCKSRRGRRHFSQISQYGINLSEEERIKMANSLCP